MKLRIELFITAETIKAKNRCFSDVDSFLVEVLQEQGLEVNSILSQEAMHSDWIKTPHNLHRGR